MKNRVHLDLAADDVEAEVARLVALGATVIARHDNDGVIARHDLVTLRDPEGNELCVGS